ncbi:DUF445 domain-containing protein [Paenibacillus doosanensis]|uniref:DUF445 domain-containing protein n=1 Tax=Paenibacillus konkukensis TaxID=2020716 RepID=A0ABY4RXB0_9BACL|nr:MULTISPECIES: DUF445 domain-containing protein [Paenibacillus]MCS7458685.1 DUF445 domain-containing protein [Paenibacillus doosanensis]UQZ86792.1 hypothetical protein SK3146_06085 [Paenibacillus konkukensis]
MSGNSKHTASVSLGVMAAGFAGTLFLDGTNPWIGFAQSGFEAGLVGGLADWFAVTALFRHPLGIPIPHTALLPKNRDKVSKAFISTIQNDLLSKQSIVDKLSQVPLVIKLLRGAQEQLSTDSAKAGIAAISEFILQQVPLEKLAAYGEREIRKLVESLDTRSIVNALLEQVYSRRYDEKVFDFVLDLAEQLVMKEEIRNRMGAMAAQALTHLKTNGLMQFALNAFVGYFNEEKLGSLIQQFILSGIEGLRMQENTNRKAVLQSLRFWLDNPAHRDNIASELDAWKEQLLTQFQLEEKLLELLKRLHVRALEWVREDGYAEAYVLPFASRIIQRIESDDELLNKLELGLREQIGRMIEANHHKIGALIQENIDRFDDETLINLMEDKVGKDLQWIRVNGAICGFLIGLVLAGVKLAIG